MRGQETACAPLPSETLFLIDRQMSPLRSESTRRAIKNDCEAYGVSYVKNAIATVARKREQERAEEERGMDTEAPVALPFT